MARGLTTGDAGMELLARCMAALPYSQARCSFFTHVGDTRSMLAASDLTMRAEWHGVRHEMPAVPWK